MVVPLTLVAVAAAAAAAAAPAAATDVQTADVLVLGAGWAGMSAAHSLALANASFLVLEATNRTGGRTHALAFGHPSVSTFVLERGSNWVSGAGPPGCTSGCGALGNVKGTPARPRENPVHRLARLEKLAMVDIPGSTQNMSNYARVFGPDGEPGDEDGTVRARANAAYDCANQTAVNMSHDALSLRDAMTKCGWAPQTAIEWAVDWAVLVDDPATPARLQSLEGALPDSTYTWWGPEDYFVVDQHPRGYARLIDAMVRDTIPPNDKRLVFDAFVTSIEWNCAGVVLITLDGRRFEAKQLVSTLPLGVLQRTHGTLFVPPLPKQHRQALSHDHDLMANLTHVLLQFRRVWWDNSLPRWLSANRGGRATSGDFAEWQNLEHASLLPGSQTLLGFVADPQSQLYEGMTDADAQAAAMAQLRKQHPQIAIPDPSAFFISRHGYDPLSYGAYSAFGTGWKDTYMSALAAPLMCCGETRVRFAGEAMCDDINGFTHAGLQSGREVAAALLFAAKKGPDPSTIDELSLCSW